MFKKTIALLLIILAIYWSFSSLKPQSFTTTDVDKSMFSTERALVHIKEMSQQPHYVGSPHHNRVRDYVITQLEHLGFEVEVQEGYSYNNKLSSLAKSKNILARIEGSDHTKALMLLSHYDSNPHSSLGASDAASGVATILEGLRAYFDTHKSPKNDIIILISDAEELDLNGALLFVNEHDWAKDIGLILNFEARGSGGPSHMLIETNGGNHNLVKGFIKANPEYPVANSLAYSIYKMLPNDTDLTPFREVGNIEGFNFAFIDDHFDYHSALDNYERLDRTALEHQGSYLMPMLNYFSNANLGDLKSDADDVYFNVPVLKTVGYPFSWIMPMLILAMLLFSALLFYGLRQGSLNGNAIIKGFIPLLLALIINGFIGYFGWTFLKIIYPQYSEILHGFTYNGHTYIWAFSFLAIAICFFVYPVFYKSKNIPSLLVAPLIVWLVLCALIAFYLKGASFFVIPCFFGLLSLFIMIRNQKPDLFLLLFLSGPTLFMLSPFVNMFPVGLGLKMLIASTLLITLIFAMLLSVFGFFEKKKSLAYVFILISLGFFITAHINSGFDQTNPKPNSLVYILNADKNSAFWATYDTLLDDWTEAFLTAQPENASEINEEVFSSKYHTKYTFTKKTDIKPLSLPIIDVQKDSAIDQIRHIKFMYYPQRKVNRIEIFTDSTAVFETFSVNGYDIKNPSEEAPVFQNRNGTSLFNLFVTDEDSLEFSFSVPKHQKTALQVYEVSYDLLDNSLFDISDRSPIMIPKPFVINDATIIKKTLSFE